VAASVPWSELVIVRRSRWPVSMRRALGTIGMRQVTGWPTPMATGSRHGTTGAPGLLAGSSTVRSMARSQPALSGLARSSAAHVVKQDDPRGVERGDRRLEAELDIASATWRADRTGVCQLSRSGRSGGSALWGRPESAGQVHGAGTWAVRFEPALAELDRVLDDDQLFQRVKAELSRRHRQTMRTGRP
jgi:hypothetical protein